MAVQLLGQWWSSSLRKYLNTSFRNSFTYLFLYSRGYLVLNSFFLLDNSFLLLPEHEPG